MFTWWRRLLRCRGGRRCAYLEVDEFRTDLPDASVTIVLDYRCGRCGTHYREEVLLEAQAHAPIPLGRERVR